MNIAHAMRLDMPSASNQTVSLVGAGGKSTALFQLARQLCSPKTDAQMLIITATSHMGIWQIPLADHHIIAKNVKVLNNLPSDGVTLVTGDIEGDRTKPVNETVLKWLRERSVGDNIPLLIEADGSRQKALKAPASHEPPIPKFTETVIVTTGLSAIDKPLTDEHVHRAQIFSQLSGLQMGNSITPQAVTAMLNHQQGGLKNIPPSARRIALLNQADTPELESIGGGMAWDLLHHFDSVIVGSLRQMNFRTFEPNAGIILAAGASTRFGSPKQLLDWNGKPFVRQVSETALHAGLSPVVVVTGFEAGQVEAVLKDLPVVIVNNPDYAQGQGASIRAGVKSLPRNVGGAVFFLADQPQIPAEVIRALTESHTQELAPIIAPLVLEERRANPVLFDRVTFTDLLQLTGDVGGRAIFSKYKVEYIPWHNDNLLLDVDNPEDYQRLMENEKK